jgi:ribulose-phosphate 3-epimerase
VSGSGIFGGARDSDPNRYDSIIAEMRAELAEAG